MSFSIEIAIVPDRKFPVAEIWFGDEMVAELNYENQDAIVVEVYGRKSETKWCFEFESWLSILEQAQSLLKATTQDSQKLKAASKPSVSGAD